MQEQPGSFLALVAFALCACGPILSSPEPGLDLPAPAPPAIEPGSVEVHARELTSERERDIRRAIGKVERRILAIYGDFLEKRHSQERGRLQLRIGIDRTGKAVQSKPVYDEIDGELVERILEALTDLDFGTGPEAWVFYSIELEPDPLQVLALRPEFDGEAEAPVLFALVENRASFPVARGRARITVVSPDGGEPRRLTPADLDQTFAAHTRTTIRIPVPREEATPRNTFLLDVEPVFR